MAITKITGASIAADAIDGTKIADDAINSEHLADGSIDNVHIADDQINSEHYAAGSVDDAHLATGITASKLTGALPAIDGSALTGVATDLTSIRNDIATLALHSAVADNKAAYNLPNSFIDQFEDDSGLGTQTDVDRNTTSEYVSSIIPAYGVNSNTKIRQN